MDWVRNEEVRRRKGVVKDLAELSEHGVLQFFLHLERMEESFGKEGH